MIQKVDIIPTAGKRSSKRDEIRADFQSAIEKGISCFEFCGDYNWRYLASYAKEEAIGITMKMLDTRFIAERNSGKNMMCDLSHFRWGRGFNKCHITITKIKGDDRNHVYAEISEKKLDEIYNEALKKGREIMRKSEERKKERAKGGDVA